MKFTPVIGTRKANTCDFCYCDYEDALNDAYASDLAFADDVARMEQAELDHVDLEQRCGAVANHEIHSFGQGMVMFCEKHYTLVDRLQDYL